MYAASELLAIAMRIEENGEEFYRRAGEKTSDQEAQLLLFFLADQEEVHRQIFAGLLAEAETLIVHEEYDGEHQAYIHACADKLVFDLDRAEPAELDGESTIRFAIQRESDSILYYTELKKILPAKHHGLLEQIIDEEKSHFARLYELLKSYKGP